LRYGRVIILSDADSDGHHIATLLLTFIYRHMPGLITGGRVFLAQPPLYRIDIGKETHWALDDAHRDRLLTLHGNGRANPALTAVVWPLYLRLSRRLLAIYSPTSSSWSSRRWPSPSRSSLRWCRSR